MKRTEIKRKPLSDTTLAGLEAESKLYRIKDSGNLYFVVTPAGTKSWQLRYKDEQGSWRWKGLGGYPEIGGLVAREKAASLVAAQQKGSPITSSRLEKKHKESVYQFEKLMNEWLETVQQSWGEVTYHKAVLSINKHLIPEFGGRNIKEIKAKEFLTFFSALRNNGMTDQVDKLLGWTRNAYSWAVIHELAEFNPCVDVGKHVPAKSRGNLKFVAPHELGKLIRDMRSYSSRNIGIGLELLVLLFPRPQELRLATWSQFNLERRVWVKPAEVMKGGQAHAVPLSHQAIQLLLELQPYSRGGELLFPSRTDIAKPISDMTFNKALALLGYKGKQDPHGLRHLASTILNTKFSDKAQVIESALAHQKKGVKSVYDKSEHFEERIELMQKWSDLVDDILKSS